MMLKVLFPKKDGRMIRFRRLLTAILSVAVFSGLISAQTSPRTPEQQQSYRKAMETADQQIADEVKAHSELMKNLEYLTTQIGPRLTGSPQMQLASDWTLKRFQDYEVEAHLETAEIAYGWTRGVDTAELTSPLQSRIGIHAYGWSKATQGNVSGNALAIEFKNSTDLEKYRGKLKGAIVLVGKPANPMKADPNPENAYDAVIPPPRGVSPGGISWRERSQLIHQIA